MKFFKKDSLKYLFIKKDPVPLPQNPRKTPSLHPNKTSTCKFKTSTCKQKTSTYKQECIRDQFYKI
jgi:hypothetical protein